jgi:putative hydrolase of the HAD superfamily
VLHEVHRRQAAVVKVALFDLDNTLFDRASAYRRWAEHYVEAAGLSRSDVEWFCQVDQDGFADRRTVWAAAKQRFDLPEPVDDLLSLYRRGYLDECWPDPAVQQALVSLCAHGWRIGIVTNGAMPQQADKADRLGLLPLVDAFCGSGELGFEKPDQRIFDEAMRRCAGDSPLERDGCWMVGDAPIPDIGGGRDFGLRTIWLHRGRRWNTEHGDPPDVTVGSLVEAVREILSHPA